MKCELCSTTAETLLWKGEHSRVILVTDSDYQGYCRVIWNSHVKEMSDLAPHLRQAMMNTVFVVESVVREILLPDKINLASLGNMTPHLHWHIIPRFNDDAHFPNPIWGTTMRKQRDAVTIDLKSRIELSLQAKLSN